MATKLHNSSAVKITYHVAHQSRSGFACPFALKAGILCCPGPAAQSSSSLLRIKYKLCSLRFSAITSTGPVHLSDLLKMYTPSRQLRSSADIRVLCIPSVNTKSYDESSFSYTGPTLCNTLPKDIRFSHSVSSFRSSLKTHLFPT